MSFINWGGESPEQKAARKRLEEEALFEQAARIMKQRASSAPTVVGGANAPLWQSIVNTAYLYPISNINAAIESTNVNFTKKGNDFFFDSIEQVSLFYYDMWYSTSLSQPQNNKGYSLGVGTQLKGSFNTIRFYLTDGTLIVTLQEMTQVTSQSDLPVSGDSPDGTVGYGAIWVDLNGDGVPNVPADVSSNDIDPLRFEKISQLS
jgi:hypothetical protein